MMEDSCGAGVLEMASIVPSINFYIETGRQEIQEVWTNKLLQFPEF